MTSPPSSAALVGSVAVLANPTAGRGRHRGLLDEITSALGAGGHPVVRLPATTVTEALRQSSEAVQAGALAVVAVGGDGTFNLALQAVAGTEVPLGLVPAGTGNDFATEVGLPAQPVAAAAAVARALRDGTHRRIDLGRCVDSAGQVRWFGAVLGAGFDSIVNERANRMRFPKGPRRYDVAIFAELVRLRPRRYTIVLDGQRHELDAVLVAVGNTASYGGGMRICPAADPVDGLLDIVIAGPVSRTTLVRIKPRVYRGTHIEHPAVRSFRAAHIELDAAGITAYVDGERAGALPMTITIQPGALRLLG